MSQRQPGSSIKPIAVYAGHRSRSRHSYSVTDMPVEVLNKTPWPKNYDVKTVGFRGQVTTVEQSINTVAAQLAKEMTPNRCFGYEV